VSAGLTWLRHWGIKPAARAIASYSPRLIGFYLTWEKRLRHYLKPDLLIIDDFALKEFTKTQVEGLYELIDRRYCSSPMIITANRSPKDWYPLFPNPVIAESALDRLISCSVEH